MQLVHLVERGERAQMSKRKGEFVTLDELIDDIGVDAARFFLLQRSHDTTMDLDLELARGAVATRTRSTTCSTRTRGSPASCARRGRSAAARRRRRPTSATRVDGARRARRARPDQAALRASERDRGGRRAPRARTGSAPTRRRSQPSSTPSTATARWSAPRATASRTSGSALCLLTKRALALTLGVLGISAPERM